MDGISHGESQERGSSTHSHSLNDFKTKTKQKSLSLTLPAWVGAPGKLYHVIAE